MAIYPSPGQVQALLERPDAPVVMVNLLRFKSRAGAPDAGFSGEEAYRLYAAAMRELVERNGGRIVWTGKVDATVIGDSEPGFHAVLLVEYPSRKKFVEMTTSQEYAAIAVHRSAGLEMQWLLATTPGW